MSANEFATAWLRGWNEHDVEAVLSHFSDDVEFTSPVAARLLGGDGVIRGKQALRDYWTLALEKVPDLHFELVGVYDGVGILVINYRNQAGGLVSEVLLLEGGFVVRGYGTYLVGTQEPGFTR